MSVERIMYAVIACVLLLSVCALASEEVTLYSIKDTYVMNTSPSEPFCSHDYMLAGKCIAGDGTEWWPLVQFDLSDIPAGAVVTSTSLVLYVKDLATDRVDLCIHGLSGSWGECVNYFGVPGHGDCAKEQPIYHGWTQISFKCNSLVQGWIDDLSSNHGVVIKPSSDCGDEYVSFWAREHGSNKPALFVTYEFPPPEPYITSISPTPTTITLGQSFDVTVHVRNDGGDSDEGGITLSFPALTEADDDAQVIPTYTSDGLSLYYDEPAGEWIRDRNCENVQASYLLVEGVDIDWGSGKSNEITLTVTPEEGGDFPINIRSAMHREGGGECEFVNDPADEGGNEWDEQQDWRVFRRTVTVERPEPRITGIWVTPTSINLGESFHVTVQVTNDGIVSDRGGITLSFPEFTEVDVACQVTPTDHSSDLSYSEYVAGENIDHRNGTSIRANYLMVEGIDESWTSDEVNNIRLAVTPKAVGTGSFDIYIRSAMHLDGGGPPDWFNAPTDVDGDDWDQQGWSVFRRTVTLNNPPEPEPDDWYAELSRHWAPAIFQDVDYGVTSNPLRRYDFVTSADFDGDQRGDNNWDHADDDFICNHPLKPYVYYNVIETQSHYFITYSLFHPRDWDWLVKSAGGDEPGQTPTIPAFVHENDLEGATFVIKKELGSEYGDLRLIGTIFHGYTICFANDPDLHILDNAQYSKSTLPLYLEVFAGDVPDSRVQFYHGQPCLFVQAGGHGIGGIMAALEVGGTEQFDFEFDGAHYKKFRGGDGIVYQPAANHGSVPGEPIVLGTEAVHHDYQLLPLEDELWPLRRSICDNCMFEDPSYHYHGGDDCSLAGLAQVFAAEDQDPGANPPWAWGCEQGFVEQGEWFLEPAYAVGEHLDPTSWNGDSSEPGYSHYIRNNFRVDNNQIHVDTPAAGSEWTVGQDMLVTWHYDEDPDGPLMADDLTAHLSRNGGETWVQIADGSLSAGQLTWTVGDYPSPACVIALRVPLQCSGEHGDAVFNVVGLSDMFTIAGDTPPEVTVTAPDGDETWLIASSYDITWTATDNIGVTSIDILLSSDGGATYPHEIAMGGANDGTHSWQVDVSPTTTARVKVIAHDAAANSGEDVSDADFAIVDGTDPQATVTAPNGGEVWNVGSDHNITWTATDDVGVTSTDILLSTDGGATFPTTIATDEANDGTYLWTVPSSVTTQARVKVMAYDAASNSGEDVSDANFTIADGTDPQVTMTAPNGAETWYLEGFYDITWTATDNMGVTSIDILLSSDGGATYPHEIAMGGANDGTHSWQVDVSPTTTARVKVIAHDAAANSGEDVSNADFTIIGGESRVWHVHPNPDSGDATTIQAGVDSAAAGDTVMLGSGIYTWTSQGTGTEEGLVRLKSGVCLLGETSKVGSVVIDAEQQGRILFCEGLTDVMIEGITLTGGYVAGMEYPITAGGGLYCSASTLSIRNCTFLVNSARWGGGVMACYASTVSATGCEFRGNSTTGGSTYGGGIHCGYGSEVYLNDCVFASNWGGFGGGLACDMRWGKEPSLSVVDCVFSDNVAYYWGGGIACLNHSVASITGSIFAGNSVSSGGGAGWGEGGGVGCTGHEFAEINRCTFYENGASRGGGIACRDGHVDVQNSVVAFGPSGEAVSCVHPQGEDGTVSIACSDIYGNSGGDWTGCIADQYEWNGNFSVDPRFCDPENGDYGLWVLSPCLRDGTCGPIGAQLDMCGCEPFKTGEEGEVSSDSTYPDVSLQHLAQVVAIAPNPFSDEVLIMFAVPQESRVRVSIYNPRGELLRVLLSEGIGIGGFHNATWDGRDNVGNSVAPGIYFCRIEAGGASQTRKMVLAR